MRPTRRSAADRQRRQSDDAGDGSSGSGSDDDGSNRSASLPPRQRRRQQQQQRRGQRRVDATSAALLALSVAIAAAALFWPQLSPLMVRLARRTGAATGTACPLGYTSADGGPLPASHPPIGAAARWAWYRAGAGIFTATEGRAGSSGGAIKSLRSGEAWLAVDEARGEVAAVAAGAAGAAAAAAARGAGGRVVDLGDGAFIVPGFIDPHVHLIPGGLSLAGADLRRASSREAFEAGVAAAAAALGEGEWILGGFWDDNLWGGDLPDASWADAAAGGRPALLLRADSHCALANTAALRLAGIDASTPEPDDGFIDREMGSGRPTGILREGATRLVSRLAPPPSVEQRRAAAKAAARHLLARGVTAVGDMGRAPFAHARASWEDLEEAYAPLADAGELPLRVYAFVPLEQWGELAARVAARGYAHRGGRLFWGGAKAFADGSLGSMTALMREPYRDQPGHRGARMIDPETLRRDAAAADAAGLQVAVHAIGDAAFDDVVGAFEAVVASAAAEGAAPPPRGARVLRVEHAQHIGGAAAAARLGALGGAAAAAVANPLHLPFDAPMLEARLGAERAAPDRSYAWPLLAAAGARVAAASDWPIVEARPLEGVRVAAARAAEARAAGLLEGAGGGGDAAAAAIAEALEMHTAAAADVSYHMGRSIGRLAPGKKADFVVLSASPFAGGGGGAAPEVVRTYVDGKCEYGCGAA